MGIRLHDYIIGSSEDKLESIDDLDNIIMNGVGSLCFWNKMEGIKLFLKHN